MTKAFLPQATGGITMGLPHDNPSAQM